MAEATFRKGTVIEYMDYTPAAGDISAGQVVLLGNTAGLCNGIAHLDITNATLGALAVGGGVYDVTMLTNLAPYTKVYWDDTNNKVTSTSTNMSTFGYLLEGNTGANTVVECFHWPYA